MLTDAYTRYRNLGVKYSGLIELRDTGTHGFLLPADEICPNSAEILAGVLDHALHVADTDPPPGTIVNF